MLTRKGVQAQVTFLNSLEQELFTVFNLEPHHTPRIIQLLEKYANLPMDLADASLVILAEQNI
ncbi:hypothetical protein [Anabaena sp. PCC 7108]|uniref:hypothetical protein n=1 Tax=Anabaena sp. PCC 7108 TaxID=163908 RepID=UPI00034943A4|nr:hypothetical protein [Anabaena sp. PCC 7108]